jgi:hypothetical protein
MMVELPGGITYTGLLGVQEELKISTSLYFGTVGVSGYIGWTFGRNSLVYHDDGVNAYFQVYDLNTASLKYTKVVGELGTSLEIIIYFDPVVRQYRVYNGNRLLFEYINQVVGPTGNDFSIVGGLGSPVFLTNIEVSEVNEILNVGPTGTKIKGVVEIDGTLQTTSDVTLGNSAVDTNTYTPHTVDYSSTIGSTMGQTGFSFNISEPINITHLLISTSHWNGVGSRDVSFFGGRGDVMVDQIISTRHIQSWN